MKGFLAYISGIEVVLNRKYYIRFGEIPEDERSSIYKHNSLIGYESGVSVYDACKIKDLWHAVLPLKLKPDTIDTFTLFRVYSKNKVYLVTGKEIGVGNDGEPLLKNVKKRKDLTNIYYNYE